MNIYWHFAGSALRDGSRLPRAGESLPEIHSPAPCSKGYHASARAMDALTYAPGSYVAQVQLLGRVIPHGTPTDKYVAERRVGITDYVDATGALRAFARACALDVLHLWDAPDVVREYLVSGNENTRSAARDATRDAARDATRDAAWAAAWAATRDAEWDAERAATRDAAQAAARAAAWDATRDAEWDAARAAAWASTRDAAQAAQNVRLTSMLTQIVGDAS